MKTVQILPEIKELCPEVALGLIQCEISNTAYINELWEEINIKTDRFKEEHTTPDINKREIIAATRKAYKLCGKDPNRYRPSSEALSRRIVSNKGLYQINTGVDLINLISFETGYSIGAFDATKINGNMTYGIGKENEAYQAIGRGMLNIAGLPILRDETGGIGTPTSDEERTKLSLETSSLLVNINGYNGIEELQEVTNYTIKLLKKYMNAKQIAINIVE